MAVLPALGIHIPLEGVCLEFLYLFVSRFLLTESERSIKQSFTEEAAHCL